ncbi:MAG: zinc ribbon domain-containing protein [Acidobacteria bacterium]|nr:zinc ribbon domain-containing protein [Acidobacteriota bacterium]
MGFCTNCGSSVEGRFCVKCGKPVEAAPAVVSPVPPPVSASAPQPPASQPRKKTSPLVWVLVAILGFFLLVGIGIIGAGIFVVHKAKQAGLDPTLMQNNPALAFTKLLAATNPNVEVVRVDERKGLITLREKSTGKIVTMDFDAAKKGKITFQEAGKPPVTMETRGEGESGSFQIKSGSETMQFGSGSAAKIPNWVPGYPGANPTNTVSMQGKEGENGSFQFVTRDSASNVAKFYEGALKQDGFRIVLQQTGDKGEGMIMAEDGAKKRSLMVTTGAGSEGTTVNVVFGVKQ